MARVAITNIAEPNVDYARSKNYPIPTVSFKQKSINVEDLSFSIRSVSQKDFSTLKSRFQDRYTRAETVLPFRIAFSSVDIPGYGRENPAPIGIAIIGTNNYIL
jgi:hypothetical protein